MLTQKVPKQYKMPQVSKQNSFITVCMEKVLQKDKSQYKIKD